MRPGSIVHMTWCQSLIIHSHSCWKCGSIVTERKGEWKQNESLFNNSLYSFLEWMDGPPFPLLSLLLSSLFNRHLPFLLILLYGPFGTKSGPKQGSLSFIERPPASPSFQIHFPFKLLICIHSRSFFLHCMSVISSDDFGFWNEWKEVYGRALLEPLRFSVGEIQRRAFNRVTCAQTYVMCMCGWW